MRRGRDVRRRARRRRRRGRTGRGLGGDRSRRATAGSLDGLRRRRVRQHLQRRARRRAAVHQGGRATSRSRRWNATSPSSASASARRSSRGPSAPTVAKAPVREIGFEPIRQVAAGAEDPVLGHYEDGAMVFQWHMDAFDLPEGGDPARRPATPSPIQAIRLGETTWATQFHAEVDAAEAEYWVSVGERGGGPRRRPGGSHPRRCVPSSSSTCPRTRLAAARPSAGSSRSAGEPDERTALPRAHRGGRLPPRRGPGGAMAARRLRRAGAVPRGAPAGRRPNRDPLAG